MTVQSAELVTCEMAGCYGNLVYLGGTENVTARQAAKASGWQVREEYSMRWPSDGQDICPACLAGRGPITNTPCPSCGGCGGNLVCVYCGTEQPRDVED